jgi:hypothetical protein
MVYMARPNNHRQYRLDSLILGANPEKLEARRRIEIQVPVEAGRGRWLATTAQAKTLISKASQCGGAVYAQAIGAGQWVRICDYKTVRGQGLAKSTITGAWFEVQAIREVR